MNIRRLFPITLPLFFELSWSQVAQRGVDTLVHIDVVEEPAQLAEGISIVFVVRQVNFLLFDGSHETLGVAVLPSLTDLGHADLRIDSLEHLGVRRGRILDALVRMVDFRSVLSQRPVQGHQRQRLVQAASQMPASDTAGEDIHDDCQVHELPPQPDVGDTCTCSAGASVSDTQT